MAWIKKYLLIVCMLLPIWQLAAQNVTKLEYFINTDPGIGSGNPLAIPQPGSDIQNLDITIPISSFNNGFNKGTSNN